ncbi:MAG TPA: aminotransferase class I/II-fold pyridoxal phosphate-dependent enzyme [Chloroflexota bacterium]|nr:aminotransferase class I/II-fold pyridoxal phosphate-dependent enzyme [Chloroflexota bacterium]
MVINLAIDGGEPVRSRPLPAGFLGSRLVGDEEKAAVLRALEGRALSRVGGLTPPGTVAAFERALAAKLGIKYALGVTSGTAALKAAVAALGIGPGDEVIVPALNFISSPESVLHFGALPVFAEVDASLSLDPEDFRRKITSRTKAVMPTHVFGVACPMNEIMAVARERGIAVVENCAWSCGARYFDSYVGTIGNIGIYSLQAVKVITAGEGGVVVTASPYLYERAVRYHNHGNFLPAGTPPGPFEGDAEAFTPELDPFVGDAFRMNELTGAVALAQVPKLDRVLDVCRAAKQRIVAGLQDLDGVHLRPAADPAGDAGIALIVTFDQASDAAWWQSALTAEGVPFRPVYGGAPVYLLPQIQNPRPSWTNGQSFFRDGSSPRYEAGLCPRTESLMARSLQMAISPEFTEEDCADVVAAVRKVAAGRP